MKEQVEKKRGNLPSVVLCQGSSFKGILSFENSLKIDGIFEGNIDSPGFLFIDATGCVKGDIKAGTVVIEGEVQGDIEASNMVELFSTGKVIGNIHSKNLIKIAEGATYEGRCDMIKSHSMLNIFATETAQLKKVLLKKE